MANPNPKNKWKKGQSGNPKGRPPKGWAWSELLEQVGEEIEPKSGKPFKELVSKRLWVECVNGNISAIKELFNRMEGFPKQPLEHRGGIDLKIKKLEEIIDDILTEEEKETSKNK